MAKGFTVKAKSPTINKSSTPEWDYNRARELVKGKSLEAANKIVFDFLDMIKNTQEIKSEELDEDQKTIIMSLSGVKQYPMRVKCATLAWHTLNSAMSEKKEEVNTEVID